MFDLWHFFELVPWRSCFASRVGAWPLKAWAWQLIGGCSFFSRVCGMCYIVPSAPGMTLNGMLPSFTSKCFAEMNCLVVASTVGYYKTRHTAGLNMQGHTLQGPCKGCNMEILWHGGAGSAAGLMMGSDLDAADAADASESNSLHARLYMHAMCLCQLP